MLTCVMIKFHLMSSKDRKNYIKKYNEEDEVVASRSDEGQTLFYHAAK